MLYLLRRLGPFQRRGVLPILLLLMVGAIALIVSTLEARTSDIELVLQPLAPDTLPPALIVGDSTPVPNQTPRLALPLLLGLRNYGPRSARPERLELFVPLHYRLRVRHDDLARVRAVLLHGDPMLRYDIELEAPAVPGDSQAVAIARPDTVWLVSATPAVRCLAGLGSMPEFAARSDDEAAPDSIRLYYAFEGEALRARQSGLAIVPGRNLAGPEPAAPEGETVVGTPRLPWPPVGRLRLVGVTRTYCGELESPQPMAATLWRTQTGGHVFGLVMDGRVRKYVYDLNRDGRAELELWDPDGDGYFEAQRRAGFRIPVSLYPQPAPRPAPPRVAQRPDTLPAPTGAFDTIGPA
ncbi:MAG: hypothetical protein ACRELV_15905, partial [Longimicrobiales bacterium]